MKVLIIVSAQQRCNLAHAPALPSFDANQIAAQAADAHLCALGPDELIRAHCSLWWKQTPSLGAHRVGAIGHYASVDGDAAAALLNEAVRILRENACSIAVGPMDGNTWRGYRFVTERGSAERAEPPFFLEPVNPPEWPHQFLQAGFTPVAEYYSALNSDLSRHDERIAPIAARLEEAGVFIRSPRMNELSDQLERIYEVSRISFTHNFLYTELSKPAFLAQYLPLLGCIQPELILLAERRGDLVGYLFAIPDLAQAQRGQAIDTVILKTVAILPQAELRGLGSLLIARAQQAAYRLGYTRAIHALMHEDNISRRISSHYAITMRRYAVYGLELK